ncbi:MAG: hypothetical protein PWQ55_274 [Chloroflexota bacterium]|nr:hypothetical protein [Chloroflexota bacterium]
MIKTLRKLVPYFLRAVEWGELLNGLTAILLGMAFTYHYGYQVYWADWVRISLWYLFYKSAVYSLNALFTDRVAQAPLEGDTGRLSPAEFRVLLARFLWVLVILFVSMSFLPLIQMLAAGKLTRLTAIIIALVYLGDLLYLIERSREWLCGFQELFYGFITAFLLPSLFFSFTRDYLKLSFVWIAFPLFMQLIAWKLAMNLESRGNGGEVSAGSMLERLDALNALSITATLLLVGSLTIFLDQELLSLWAKLILAPLALLSAWLVYRSVKKQHPYWDWALPLIRFLPILSISVMILSLWNH